MTDDKTPDLSARITSIKQAVWREIGGGFLHSDRNGIGDLVDVVLAHHASACAADPIPPIAIPRQLLAGIIPPQAGTIETFSHHTLHQYRLASSICGTHS